MTSERGELAAARVAAAAHRAEQLRERIARLRAGETSTAEDVELAKASAAHQREEAARAQERLLHAYAAAAVLRSGRALTDRTRPAEAVAEVDEDSSPTAEMSILRRALISIASSGEVKGGWPKARRQELWQAMADQCGQQSWKSWSHALCRTTLTQLPGLRGVAISGYDHNAAPHLLAVSDEWTRQVEEIGQLVGEGPGMDAYRAQSPVLVKNLEDEQARWPGFVTAAAGVDLTSVYAFPVQLNGVSLASLTLYPHDQDRSGWRGWPDAFFVATVAAKAVLADLDAMDDGWPLSDAGDDRVSIATGMLAAQLAVGVDEASALLRAYAFGNARGLGEVAHDVLEGSLRIT